MEVLHSRVYCAAMAMRLLYLLAASVVAACQPSTSDDPAAPSAAHSSAGRTSAARVALEFEVLENFDAGGFRAALTLTNHREQALAGDWLLYFNFVRAFAPDSAPAGVAVTRINGDFFRLEPTASFEPLAPGDSRRIELQGPDFVVRETDAPAGFYFVFRGPDGPQAPEPAAVTVAPFLTPKQTRRTAADQLTVPTPASRYQQNRALARLADDEILPILPSPVSLARGDGSLTLESTWGIQHGAGLEREAAYLAQALAPVLGATPETTQSTGDAPPQSDSGRMVLEIGPANVAGTDRQPGDEAYLLEIDPRTGIRITGSDAAGVFYGIQSLRALLPIGQGPVELPALAIEDAPRFGYRGMHLDVARNFQSKESVLQLLDLMAFYKLNRFHFHLSDDEGWRLAIAGLPELTEVGGRRGHTLDERDHLVPSFGSGPDPDPAASNGSGHYTRQDFIDILRHARDRHIEVIPELDFPGHARAAVKAMAARHARLAELGDAEAAAEYLLNDPGDESRYRSVQGWTDNVVDVCLESTYSFLQAVADDVVAIYAEAGVQLEVFHIGGDEVPAGVWEESPACRRLIEENSDLAGAGDLARYFLRRLSSILDRHGLITAGWEEIALEGVIHGGNAAKVPNQAFVDRRFRPYVWNSVWGWGSEDTGYRLANAGYQVVLSNASNLYFDLAYDNHPQEPGSGWAGFVDTRKPWELQPLDLFRGAREDKFGRPIDAETAYASAVRLTAEGRRNVLGIQGQLWGENARGAERMEYLAFPKLLGLAERAWAQAPDWAQATDPADSERLQAAAWNEFANRLGQRELPRLDRFGGGIRYRLPPPGAVIEDGKLHANVAFPGLEVRYTSDGGEPTAASPLYAEPVAVSGTVKLKTFDTRGRGSRMSVVSEE